MFTKAIVRKPGMSMIHGLSAAGLGTPEHALALIQHAAYVEALQACGLDVTVLDADERYPDSTFIEDVALLTRNCAIITNPGAPSRKGETAGIRPVLKDHFTHIEVVQEPGTVEGGDIMMAGDHFYIGLSDRTNLQGARQVIAFLEDHGLSGSTLPVGEMLHLKTGIAYLENNTIAATREALRIEDFHKFTSLEIAPEESYAANCLWLNGTVLVAKGFPKAAKTIKGAGYPIIEVDVSEFRKLDGGLSCLSLRF
jgi:dimethylargininase